MNKNIFKAFKIDCPIIAVMGTNGKTMTNNCISSILKTDGKKVISNLRGNNMTSGVLSLLLKHCTLTGRVKADFITLEVDESYVPIVFKELKLDTLVILNFFRDQLDRVGEIESLILKIDKFLKEYNGNLILNADDPNVARLGKSNLKNNNIYYFSVDRYKYATEDLKEAGEGKYCPFCSTRLEYEYYQYAHIGKFICPKCNYGNNEIFKCIENVDLENKTFTVDNEKYKIKFNGIYSIYNFAAAISTVSIYNVDKEVVKKALSEFVLNNGRQENLVVAGNDTIINLAKNPTGVNVSLRLLNEDNEPKELLLVLNDNEADGRDVSWIWDVNFQKLNNVKRVITSGKRAFDMAICIKTSGFCKDNIEPYLDLQSAVEALYKTDSKKYVISNYTAVQDTRHAILKYKEENKE